MAQEAGKIGIGFGVKPNSAQLTEIAGLIEAGKVKVGQLTLLKLEECRQAHELSESGRTVGKIVLQVE
jgi:NADPH:quinone reductase-like Zn-dependent oxidoreductase